LWLLDDPDCSKTVLRTQVWRITGEKNTEGKRKRRRNGEEAKRRETGDEEKTV
jgi:hypothetical protein